MSQLTPELFDEARKYLTKHERELLDDVEIVLKRLTSIEHINDYSFVIAPISKTYEGYLKDFFLKIGIIDQYNYSSDRYRVGKTLNPSLRYKNYSIYQKLTEVSDRGEELAELLWDAWKFGRNEIFHYFPTSVKNLDRAEAEERISLLLNAIIKSGKFVEEQDIKTR